MAVQTSKLRVFISSTCYDLLDLRAELRHYLEDNGFSVSLSEDAYSPFLVDPTADSIASCLNNVESSDVVVCIIDSRYGTPVRTKDVYDKSATHAEVEKARERGRPIFFFMREQAWVDYQQLRENPDYRSKWVEKGRGNEKNERQERWVEFVNEVAKLPTSGQHSNWCDTFRSVADLKPLVLKRLLDQFPEHVGAQAMQPERLVRLTFELENHRDSGRVNWYFRNVGIGPALDLKHGYGTDHSSPKVMFYGALGDGERMLQYGDTPFEAKIIPQHKPFFFAEYSNRFGDRYRVEATLSWSTNGYVISGPEKFFPIVESERIR